MQKTNHFPDQCQCAHAWAHQSCEAGTASNFFFDGNTIYSYGKHFPIATICGNIVLFTERRYSNTTAKHNAIAASAVSHKRIIYVYEVSESSDPLNHHYNHERNLTHWIGRIEKTLFELAAHPKRTSLLTEIQRCAYRIEAFTSALNIPIPAQLPVLLDTPIYKAAQETKGRPNTAIRDKALKAYYADLRKWEAGEIDQVSSSQLPDPEANIAFLRWNDNKRGVETSKGIQIPEQVAFSFWQYIRHTLAADTTECNYTIQGFQVTEISSEWVKAGCHHIPMSQVQKIATLLEWA